MAQKLRAIRAAAGFGGQGQSAAFAAFLGVDKQRWSNVENGVPLGLELAMILCRKTGVDMNYLYHDRTEGLPVEMARRLGALPETAGVRKGKRSP